MATILKYPLKVPVSGDYLDGPDGPTGPIDYLKIQRFRIDYGKSESGYGGTNLPNSKVETILDPTVAYIAMPSQLATSYNADYEQVAMGAGGVFGAQTVSQIGQFLKGDGFSAEQATTNLQNAAAGLLPEFAYNKASNMISSFGLGSVSGNNLQALTAGRIMNPFTEQVFNGVQFRSHQFTFKMFAKNQKEAQEILQIIKYLKIGALPQLGDADLDFINNLKDTFNKGGSEGEEGEGDDGEGTNNDTAPASASTAAASATPTNLTGKFLKVPDRYLLEFVRMDPNTNTVKKLPHYKFHACVCNNISINYTPDGQYVSFKDAIADLSEKGDSGPTQIFVPAVEIGLSFAETRFLTQTDAASGY